MSTPDFDIIIHGAGVVGLTLAALLARTSLRIALIDQNAHIAASASLPVPYDSRVYALNLASQHLFESLEIWQTLQAMRTSVYDEMRVWDENSPAHIEFHHTEVNQPYLGHIVEHAVLQQGLRAYLNNYPNIQWFLDASIQKLWTSDSDIQVDLKQADPQESRSLTAQLLVGADGSRSTVAQLAGIIPKRIDTQHSAIVATLHTEFPHQQIARQRFLTLGPLALLPLADPNWVSIVWSTTQTQAEDLAHCDVSEFERQITYASEFCLGNLTLLDKPRAIALNRHYVSHYIQPRVALVGDAAHAIHPLAGQGVNLGLQDVHHLAELLKQTRQAKRDLGAQLPLRRYERHRKTANLTMLAAMEGFRILFGNQQAGVRYARYLGMELTAHLPLLKSYLMRHALGI